MLVVIVADRVFKDGGIAEAQLVILFDHGLLGLLIALIGEFLRFEGVGQLAGLMDLTEGTLTDECTLNLAVLQLLITHEGDLVDFHLGLLVDIDVKAHLPRVFGIFRLNDIDLGILVAFLVEVFLGKNLGTVDDVTRQTHAAYHTELLLHVLTLRLLDTMIGDRTDAGTKAEMDTEIYLVANDGVGSDAHLREQSIAPIAFDGFGDLTARNLDLLADSQSGKTSKHIVLIAFDTLNGNAADLARTGCAGIGDVGIDDLILCF